ncbi:MAG: DUF4278 domain-containing protein, partial [Cyanobacteria bacterium P01_H01_bin.121]
MTTLSYRSIKYDYTAPAVEIEAGAPAKYRGAAYTQHYLKQTSVEQPVRQLQYRGVAYCTDGSLPLLTAT